MTDLQSDIKIDGSVITGNLKYVTGYTGFSGDPAEQEGNYIALHAETDFEADEITLEVINGTVGHPVTLDSDGLMIVRITNKDTQKIRIVATKGSRTRIKLYDLSGLKLAEA
ncbi:MAG: hypothetical protein IKH82_05655 [Clostridiales bacterium]|nr:hypothetical protein [Clostridiales bacterium]